MHIYRCARTTTSAGAAAAVRSFSGVRGSAVLEALAADVHACPMRNAAHPNGTVPLLHGATHQVSNQSPPLQDMHYLKSNPRYAMAVKAIEVEVTLQTKRKNKEKAKDDGGQEDLSASSSSSSAAAVAAALKTVEAYGQYCGSEAAQRNATSANKHGPTFSAYSRTGERGCGTAEFHPSYHALMKEAIEAGVPSMAWQGITGSGSNIGSCSSSTKSPPPSSSSLFVLRAAMCAMHYQLEAGTSCPLTMTFAGVAPLLRAATAAQEGSCGGSSGELTTWVQKLTSPHYDPRDVSIAQKQGATIGMSMTEKQGGSDVRANTTTARPLSVGGGGSGGSGASGSDLCTLNGHKWFTSAPMSDAFLTLAQVPTTSSSSSSSSSAKKALSSSHSSALTCFLVPRWIDADTPNKGLQFQRLKDKLGDRSNASTEVEYRDAIGLRIGEIGQGVKTIIEMVNYTRLDCLIGSAALMQRAALEACHHWSHRAAFGGPLADKPLAQNVLADLAIESEAANALAVWVSELFGKALDETHRSVQDPQQQQTDVGSPGSRHQDLARIAVAAGKFLVCKRVPHAVAEALECLGGNGYTEDFPLSRFYRQAPLNAVWEGSGNVIALDVLRALAKEPAARAALEEALGQLVAADRRLGPVVTAVSNLLRDPPTLEMHARRLVGALARLLQARALQRTVADTSKGSSSTDRVLSGNTLVYEAFVQSRLLVGGSGDALSPVLTATAGLFGTLPASLVSREIIMRITPQ